jgi:TM2 domain-containing membrane protein YozV
MTSATSAAKTSGNEAATMDEIELAEVTSKKLAAGLLGIFLGSLGIHKFVLGYSTAGVIMLVITFVGGVVTCGIASGVMAVIGLIEGIIYLTMTPQQFKALYIDAEKQWF